ncbi:hypothetical protein CHU98_g8114, partial [Xylaria longipes]
MITHIQVISHHGGGEHWIRVNINYYYDFQEGNTIKATRSGIDREPGTTLVRDLPILGFAGGDLPGAMLDRKPYDTKIHLYFSLAGILGLPSDFLLVPSDSLCHQTTNIDENRVRVGFLLPTELSPGVETQRQPRGKGPSQTQLERDVNEDLIGERLAQTQTSGKVLGQLKPSQHGPPYSTTLAVVGGVPTLTTDIPIAAVLLALFAASAAAHITILHANKRNGLKFLFSGMMFALCVLRSVALGMRITWATSPHVANIAIAAGILTQTGSVIVFIVNLILAQRVVRAYHPRFGWHPATTSALWFLVGCTVASLIMVITVTVQSFFTLDADIRRSDRIVQLFGGTYMAVLAF